MKIQPNEKKLPQSKKDELKKKNKLKDEGNLLSNTDLIELVLELKKKNEDLEKRLAKLEGKK